LDCIEAVEIVCIPSKRFQLGIARRTNGETDLKPR